MTDLEMTKLCAEALGVQLEPELDGGRWRIAYRCDDEDPIWWPLDDNAQAMVLVKKIYATITYMDGEWRVEPDSNPLTIVGVSPDLNRAIVECVAKIQRARMG